MRSICLFLLMLFLMMGISHAQEFYSPPSYIIRALAWNPDGNTVVAGYHGGYVQLIDPQNNDSFAKFDLDDRPVFGVAWSPNGKLVAGASNDGPVHIWDVVNRKSFQSFTIRLHPLALNWSADSKHLLVGAAEENTLSVWDVEASKILKERDDSGSVIQIVWSPDGKTLGIANPVGRVVLTGRPSSASGILKRQKEKHTELIFTGFPGIPTITGLPAAV